MSHSFPRSPTSLRRFPPRPKRTATQRRFVTLLAPLAVATVLLGTSSGGAVAMAQSVSGGLSVPSNSACGASWSMYQHDAHHTADGCSSLGAQPGINLRPAWFFPTVGAVT